MGFGFAFCRFGYIELGEFGFAGGLKKEGARVTIEKKREKLKSFALLSGRRVRLHIN